LVQKSQVKSEFQDKDGKKKIEVVPTSLLTAGTKDFIKRMTDAHYIWPEARTHRERLVGALSVQNPAGRIAVTVVPGWHQARYVLPDLIASPKGDNWTCHFYRNDNVLLPKFVRCGDRAGWQNHVAKSCQTSSRLTLAMGAAFAATILRKVNLDTFGFYFVGKTSKGKTLCLKVAGSVAGLNAKTSPTSWDGTPTGFQQLALGHRDNVMLLDDTSAIEGDAKKRREFAKLAIFSLAKNQQKIRSGHYDRLTDAVRSDWRSIILASGEDILFEPGFKTRGEDVQMIHIPADTSELGDIFDRLKANAIAGATVNDRNRYVNALEKATFTYQGKALRAFVRRLVADAEAEKTIQKYMQEFVEKSPLQVDSAFARIRQKFAVVYTGLALAIDYKILPLDKGASLRDVQKCMNDSINLLIERTGSPGAAPFVATISDDELVEEFLTCVAFARFAKVSFQKKSPSAGVAEAADGFLKYIAQNRVQALLLAKRLREWYPDSSIRNRLVRLLRARQMLHAGRQNDALTHLVTAKSHGPRLPCYWLSLKAMGLSRLDLEAKRVNSPWRRI
jgi:putative DNA primase/helicase